MRLPGQVGASKAFFRRAECSLIMHTHGLQWQAIVAVVNFTSYREPYSCVG